MGVGMSRTIIISTALLFAIALPGCGCGGDAGLSPLPVGPIRLVRIGGIVFVQNILVPKPGQASTLLGPADPTGDRMEDVSVELWTNGFLVGTLVTNNLGEYVFDDSNVTGGLQPSTAYEVRIDLAGPNSSVLDFLTPMMPNAGTDDQLDSDGDPTILGGFVVAPFTTPADGDDFSIDFGFLLIPQ